jgi:hypothetical protein
MDIEEVASFVAVVQFGLQVLSGVGFTSKKNEGTDNFSLEIFNHLSKRVYAILFLSFSCAFAVNVFYLWTGFFGAVASDDEIYQYIAAQLTVPALLLLREAYNLYFEDEAEKS